MIAGLGSSAGDVLTDDEASFLRDFAVSSGNHGLLPRDQPKGPDPSFLDVLEALGGPYAAVPEALELAPNLPVDPFLGERPRATPAPKVQAPGVPTWVYVLAGVAVAAGAAVIIVRRGR